MSRDTQVQDMPAAQKELQAQQGTTQVPVKNTRPKYDSVAQLAAWAKRRCTPGMQSETGDQSAPTEADLKSVTKLQAFAFGKRYNHLTVRDDLRFDDDRNFLVERGNSEEERQAAQKAVGMKVRDFAYEAHGCKAPSGFCQCRKCVELRSEFNHVLRHHGLPEVPVTRTNAEWYQKQLDDDPDFMVTQPATPVELENSALPSGPNGSPANTHINADDLATALAAANLGANADTTDSAPAHKESVETDASSTVRHSPTTSPVMVGRTSMPEAQMPRTPDNTARSLTARQLLEGLSPLTPLPPTPIASVTSTLKRKRSDMSVVSTADNLHCELSVERTNVDAGSPKKKIRKTAANAVAAIAAIFATTKSRKAPKKAGSKLVKPKAARNPKRKL